MSRRLSFIGATLLFGLIGLVAEATAPTSPSPSSPASLAEVARALGTGWVEFPHTTITSVLPSHTETEWGTLGPTGVIRSWNGAAYDAASGEWYFHGGGHADYGGNEVYRFSFRDLSWKRLTKPSRYPPRARDPNVSLDQRCPYPLDGPPSMHTYNGKVFSPKSRTMFMMTNIAFCPSGAGERWVGEELWEFNPSENEARHGLAPLKWRRHDLKLGVGGFPHTVALPDGNLLLGGNSVDATFDPGTLTVKQRVGPVGDQADGTIALDAKRGILWLINRDGLHRLQYRNGSLGRRVSVTRDLPGGVSHTSGLAVHERSGKLVFWHGGSFTVTFDPDGRRWELNEHPTGPSAPDSTVYNKWIYLAEHDVFAGFQNSATGVYLYRLPASGQGATTQQIQTVLDTAAPGARVKIPPGLYSNGGVLRKPLTVDMAGVRILSPAEGKGALVVEGVKGVVIENLGSSGLFGGGNFAAVRLEGDFDVTIRRAHIAKNEMGILADNQGGRLVVEDSTIEEMGYANSDLGHLVYAGAIDDLVIRNSVLRISRNRGHLVKSRAKRTLIDRSYLLGMDGYNSREIDLPCGGEVVIRNSVIQKGAGSENSDMIGFATEAGTPENCPHGLHRKSSLTLEGNWLIFDRSGPNAGRPAGNNHVVNDLSRGAVPIRALGNRIVNMRDWGFTPAPPGNTILADRPAAGLAAYPALPSLR